MESLYWLVVIIIMTLIGMLAFRGRYSAEKGNYGILAFCTVLGLYLARNAYLLIRSGGWASELNFFDDLSLSKALSSGWVDLFMNVLLTVALMAHLKWEIKTETQAINDVQLIEALKKLKIDGDALIELSKLENLKLKASIIVTYSTGPTYDQLETEGWETVSILNGLNKKSVKAFSERQNIKN